MFGWSTYMLQQLVSAFDGDEKQSIGQTFKTYYRKNRNAVLLSRK
jgi:hypothetical protein